MAPQGHPRGKRASGQFACVLGGVLGRTAHGVPGSYVGKHWAPTMDGGRGCSGVADLGSWRTFSAGRRPHCMLRAAMALYLIARCTWQSAPTCTCKHVPAPCLLPHLWRWRVARVLASSADFYKGHGAT